MNRLKRKNIAPSPPAPQIILMSTGPSSSSSSSTRNNNTRANQQNDDDDDDPNNEDSLLTSNYYKEWSRLLRKSSRLRESMLKFLVNFVVYSGETASLVFTLITGIMLPEDAYESYAAITLHVIACLVTIAVNYANSKRSKGFRNSVAQFLMNIAFLTKPFRYLTLYRLGRSRLRIIEQETENGQLITENGLQALAKLNKQELEDKRVEVHECYFQNLPMTILQAYLLFQSHDRFQLCNIKDLSRLSAILLAIAQSAKASAAYESSKHDLEQTLNFLAYYKSQGAHPMVIYSKDMFSINGVANLLAHFFTILTRVYTCMFFVSISFTLSAMYLLSVFGVNLLLLKLYPQHLLDIYQNPPYGISTTPSYYSDRWINVFSNIGTRFHKFTNKRVLKLARLPLILLQLLHFAIPLAIVYSTKFYFEINATTTPDHDPNPPQQTINSTLESCPELEAMYNLSPITRQIGKVLFSSYRSADDAFQTFNDIFGMFHVLWLLFYIQVAVTWVLAFADLMMRKKSPSQVQKPHDDYFTPTYPILTGYSCYSVLLSRVISLNDAYLAKKLIVLTLAKEPEFYNLFRRACCCWGGNPRNKDIAKLATVIADRLPCRDDEVLGKINNCISSGHRFLTEFLSIREILYKQSGSLETKKLFLGFFAYFDAKLYVLSSDRIERIFNVCCGGAGCCSGNSPMRDISTGSAWDGEDGSGNREIDYMIR